MKRLLRVLSLPKAVTHRGRPGPTNRRLRRLDDGEQADLVRAYLEGATVYELAAGHGVHRKTVSTLLKRQGIPLRYNVLDPPAVEHAAQLYSQGLSLASVAARFDVCANTLRTALRSAGVPTRPVGTNQWS